MKINWNQWIKNVKGENPIPDVINWFIHRYNYISYLELGLRRGDTYNVINCIHKESVDNDSKTMATYNESTDEFFNRINEDKKWDVIFIDADHKKESVLKDIINSLKHLNKNGVIFTHDVNPLYESQLQDRFCNNAWQAFVHLRQTRKDLSMYTFPFNMLGLIKVGTQLLWKDKVEWTWTYFDTNRKKLVNELNEEEFYIIFERKKLLKE